MRIPEKLEQRLQKLGMNANIYEQRSRKCMLSREPLNLGKVPWYENAYYVSEKSSDEFIFDPVSLVPCLALDPKSSERILDMCAAPGTKTFILSFLSNNESHIVANDISKFRARRLRGVVDKYGLSAEVTVGSGRKIKGSFDKVLLDAPCSGEGMINKKEKLFEHWSEKRVKVFSKKQKKLLVHAFELLKPGGTLVYSTCTFEPEENEEVVDFLLKKHGEAEIEDIQVPVNHAPGLTTWDGKMYDNRVAGCVRIYPFHNGTGGFFVSKIRKN